MDLLYDEIMLYHDESLLDRYIEERLQHPEGRVGHRFGILMDQSPTTSQGET